MTDCHHFLLFLGAAWVLAIALEYSQCPEVTGGVLAGFQ